MDKDDTNRKRKNSDIPMCKYGLSCYRKNPEHHKKFKHPSIQRDDAEDQDDEVSSAVEGKKKCLDIKSELPELETENQDDGVSREVEENACMDIKSELPELDEESEDDGVSSAVEEKRRGIDVSESPELVSDKLSKSHNAEDQYDIIGKNIANKMRMMKAKDKENAVMVENLINQIILKGNRGDLTVHSEIKDNKPIQIPVSSNGVQMTSNALGRKLDFTFHL